MRVIAKSTLSEFWETHADSEQQLRAWHQNAERAEWKSLQDIKNAYQNASILPNNRVVFNIKGNDYRLLVKIHYNTGFVYIRFVGTHREYDDINAENALGGSSMEVRPIRTEEDYRATLRDIELLMDAELNSPEEERLEVLGTLVQMYEAKHYPILPPDPVEAIE